MPRPANPLRLGGLACCALLAACAPPGAEIAPETSATPGVPARGGTVVIGTTADIGGLNDILSSTTVTTGDVLYRMLFLHLFEERPDFAEHPPTFAPRLAESYEWSADRLLLTVRLRPDVVWSDGVPVTAEDVRWTWQAQTDPDVGWDYAFAKEAITDVEIVDSRTVRVHFKNAYFSQLADVNEGVILPKHAWSALPFKEWRSRPEWFQEHFVSDGPFVLASWTPQQELVLRRNERYYEKDLPRLDSVVVRVIPDRANQLAQLRVGSLDYVEQLPPARAAEVRAWPNARVLSYWTRQYGFVEWNVTKPLFADPEVRRALTQAIDRQAIVDTLWRGFGKVSDSPILSTVWAHAPNLAPWPYAPDETRRLLAARGWRDSDGDGVLDKDGRKFSFELLTNAGNEIRRDATVMIQEQLRRVGVEARPQTIETNALLSQLGKHDFDATLLAYSIDTSLDISYAFHSSSIKDGYNYGGYSNPEMDKLLDEFRTQTEPEAAKSRLVRAQLILHAEQPYTFLWEAQRLDVASARLQDPRPNALSAYFHIREWWLSGPR
jgi:peptide/nickel transport system substrate-binding protein